MHFPACPPFTSNEMVDVINPYPLIPDADTNKSLHDVGEGGLLVLIRPSAPQRRIIKDRFKTLQDSEDMVDDLYGFIEDDEEGMAIVYLFLFVNADLLSDDSESDALQKMTGVID